MIKLNGVELKPTIFPDGTSQVWKFGHNRFGENVIYFEFENEAEIFQLYQLLDFLFQQRKQYESTYVCLDIPFLPYSRQDKRYNAYETFALNSFLNLLRSFGDLIDGVSTLDVHNSESIKNTIIRNKDPNKEIRTSLISTQPNLVCYPDKGAKDRYSKMPILEDFPCCSFSKERDQSTGYIKELTLNEDVDVQGKTILIIDDICDGGMTFRLAAEKLLTLGAKEVNLYTTHGIYSKGVQVLRDSGISRIFNRKGEVE